MMGYGFGGGLGMLIPLLFLGALILGVVWIMRSLQGRRDSRDEVPGAGP